MGLFRMRMKCRPFLESQPLVFLTKSVGGKSCWKDQGCVLKCFCAQGKQFNFGQLPSVVFFMLICNSDCKLEILIELEVFERFIKLFHFFQSQSWCMPTFYSFQLFFDLFFSDVVKVCKTLYKSEKKTILQNVEVFDWCSSSKRTSKIHSFQILMWLRFKIFWHVSEVKN